MCGDLCVEPGDVVLGYIQYDIDMAQQRGVDLGAN